jgi:uncharacterized protein YcbX
MSARVTRLQTTPIKGIRVNDVSEVLMTRSGAVGDRRFFLVDERDRKVNGKLLGMLQAVTGEFEESTAVLSLELPGGERVSGTVAVDADRAPIAYGDFRAGRLVHGPWADALSELCGRTLRLIMTESAVDRGTKGAISLVSHGSLRRLAEQAQTDELDSRRFRMLIEVDGVTPHAEDEWVGREALVGETTLRFEGHVGRCVITSRDPETGEKTLPTLELLRSYRGDAATTEPLAFGIYGRVLRGGVVRIGDTVAIT